MRVILYALCSLLVLSRMKHSTCKGMRQSGLKFRKIAFWMTLCYVGSCARAACLPDEFICTNDECIPVESQCDRYNDCGDNSDEVGCICYTGDIRLLGGQSAAEGTMELCSLNTWAATCGEYFSGDDARVICRQLGFNSSIARYNSFYGRGSSIYTWGNVVGGCIGNESMLLYCPRNPSAYTCSRDELAGVQCSIPYCPSPNFQCANSLCIDYNYRCDGYNDCRDNSDEQNCSCYRGSVRLVGGESPAEGTLEVCNANTWGTICDSLWNANDTRVVCRQFGYTNASIHISKSLFGHGTTATTWKTIGGCRGTESSLTSCRFTAPVSCNNTSLAGARCFECSGSEYYLCANARCISSKHRCDSVDNCGDGSDEANCDLPTISSIAFVVRKREGMSWALIGGVAGGIVGELAFVFLLGICIVIGVRYHRRHKTAVKITSETHAASALQLESAVCDMPARSSEILNLQIMSVPNFPELSAAPTVVTSSVAPAIQETSSSSITPPSAQEVVNASAVYDVMSAQIASAIDELTTMQVSFASNNPLLQSNTACSQEQDQVPSLQLLPHIVASENC